MRVLVVSQYFWPENFRVNDICAGLIEKGHEVTVLTGIPNYPDGYFFPGYGLFKKTQQNHDGIKIARVPLFPRLKGSRLCLILNYFSFVFFGSLFAPFLLQEKYDVIFVFAVSPVLMAIPAIFLTKLRKIPMILYVLDLWPESISAVGAFKSPFILELVKKVVRFIYKNSDKILVSSPGFIGQIEKIGIDKASISYWPQWAEDDYSIFDNEKEYTKIRNMPSGFKVMFAGNIGAAQSFGTIIEAAKKLKDFSEIHLIILGDGRMRPWVEEQIRLHNLETTVHLLGRRPLEEMPSYFAKADVLLVSLRGDLIFSLTIPAKIQSYMACGRPIIACLNGEGARIVEESGAGFSCHAEDPAALAESILKMYRLDDSQRKAMAMNSRAYFEKHFTRDILLTELNSHIKALT
jgi:colanic acid biosynthesis glycosyl transferase WcaI